MKSVDVLILGGGPAGSLTAALINQQNPDKTVMILEKAHFPRHHVGEVTLPGWSKILKRAGILEKLDAEMPIKKAGVLFHWGPDPEQGRWTADFRETKSGRPAEGSWHVDRALFDHIALKHARSLGTLALEGASVLNAQRLENGFVVDYEHEEKQQRVQSAHIIDASGQARLLSRWWKLPVSRHGDLNNFAIYGYWKDSKIAETDWKVRGSERWATISACEKGWVWHIPIKPNVVSVGWVSTKDTVKKETDVKAAYFEQALTAESVGPLLADAVYLGNRPCGGEGPDSIAAVQDWSYQVKECAGEGWMLIGDAAMFVDPILSSGLTLAANGANMAANALNTLWTDPKVNPEQLRNSFQRAMQDQAAAYLQMAKVWYRQNLSVDSWHWTARQQRLSAGGLSLYERDQDAFTALCLGAVGSPLDAVASKGSKNLWGSEFFAWITAGRLFSPGESRQGNEKSADKAREETQRHLTHRWRLLLNSRPKLSQGRWENHCGYHTNAHLKRWEKVNYLRFYPDQFDSEQSIIFPCFSDYPESLLPLLNGQKTTFALMNEALSTHKPNDDGFFQRQKAYAELILQLDLMGCLHSDSADVTPPPKGQSPLFKGPFAAVLKATTGPIEFNAKLDWTGHFLELAIQSKDNLNRVQITVDKSTSIRWMGVKPKWEKDFSHRLKRWARQCHPNSFDEMARHAGLEMGIARDEMDRITAFLPE